jgi:hypothetical protein
MPLKRLVFTVTVNGSALAPGATRGIEAHAVIDAQPRITRESRSIMDYPLSAG